jgi:hypothetical protein
MVVAGILLLIVFIWYVYSKDSALPYSKNLPRDDENLSKWREESNAGKTSLTLKDWKKLQDQNESVKREQALKNLFKELLDLGIDKQNMARRGVIRSTDSYKYSSYYGDFAKSFGIHPEEASLIKRKEKAEATMRSGLELRNSGLSRFGSGPTFFDRDENLNLPVSNNERLAAAEELKKIDNEWSLLNNRLLDQYYFNDVEDISRNDFVMTYHPPIDNSMFPYSAGQWHATSKLWGLKHFDGHIRPISGESTSKNQALLLALDNIQTRNEQHNDLVPVPFNPWDADL